MLMCNDIDTRLINYLGRKISVKDHCLELKQQEFSIPISSAAIEFCRKQIEPANTWGVWHTIFEMWREEGLSNREMFQAVLRIPVWGSQHAIYCARIRNLLMCMLDDVALAEEFCNDAIHHPDIYFSFAPSFSATEGLVVLAKHNKLPSQFCSLLDWRMPKYDLQTVIRSLAPEVHRRVLLELCSKERLINNQGIINPLHALNKLHPVLDVLPAETLPLVHELMDDLRKNKGSKPEEIAAAESLIQAFESNKPWHPVMAAEGITQAAANTVHYLQEQQKKRARLGSFDPYIESLLDRHITVCAKELLSITAWKSAPSHRKNAIVKEIEKAVDGLTFTGFAENALSIAVFKHKSSKQVLSLVPGGEFEMGLSAAEEQVLRQHLETGTRKICQEDLDILGVIAHMRPLRRVQVGPMLVAQKVSVKGDIAAVLDWLESQPFRVPSETEWEYVARGTKQHELTWHGNVIPDQAWMKANKKHLNEFQLGDFGFHAEVCADVWRPIHTAVDARPVTGTGSRVCRGGASDLAPWQETGEWHLLCTAFRHSAQLVALLAVRAVIGIQVET